MYGAMRLDIGTLREPGTGFLPFLAGCAIVLLSGVIIVQAALKKGRAGNGTVSSLWRGVRPGKLFALGFLLLAYVFAFERLGFFLTSFFMLFALFRFVEGLPWRKTIVLSLAASAGLYVLLDRLLYTPLPKGFLGF